MLILEICTQQFRSDHVVDIRRELVERRARLRQLECEVVDLKVEEP